MSRLALKRRGVRLPTYGNWFTRAQGSHRGRNEWPGGVREWCGRRERSERATVARGAGPRRVAPFHSESRPERSASGVEDPADGGVGAVSTCGTIPIRREEYPYPH